MKLRLRNKGKVFSVDEPVSIEVIDATGALLAVVVQRDSNNVQILTPGDTRFDTYAAVHRMATSVATVLHKPDATAGVLGHTRL